MSDPYEVFRYGTDTSGRAIYMNRRMEAALNAVHTLLHGVRPTIVQGAYMTRVGGGAPDSAGYHDAGGCLDWRTWDLPSKGLTEDEVIRAMRTVGWAAWVRNAQHGGMDPHIHGVLLDDRDAASGAKSQMYAYRSNRDGLSSNGPDYHWRPSPLATWETYQSQEADDMFEAEDRQRLKDIQRAIAAFREGERNRDDAERERDSAASSVLAEIRAAVDKLPDGRIQKGDVRDVIDRAFAKQFGEVPEK